MSTAYHIWRHPQSHFGLFGYDIAEESAESITAAATYTDSRLREIAEAGFNAIWVHAQLHHLANGGVYPELAMKRDLHRACLRRLMERAARHGIKLFLYMQPPRALPDDAAFWIHHPEARGNTVDTWGDDGSRFTARCMCTSDPTVRRYLTEAFRELTEALPELGGYIIISASEYPSHCYGRCNSRTTTPRARRMVMDHVAVHCPRCSQLEPEEVIIRLLWDIRNGVRAASEQVKLIFWDWSWTMYVDDPSSVIIPRLPQDCGMMLDFERGGYRDDGVFINEYALGYAGPSEQFQRGMKAALEHGMEVMAKLQLGTTHELASVVSLPAIAHLQSKARFMRGQKIDNFLGCWNFGNFASANPAAFNHFLRPDCPLDADEALEQFAGSYFPGCDTSLVSRSWKAFSAALAQLPFHVPFLYYSPLNYAPAFLGLPQAASGQPVGRSWLADVRGDDLCESIGDIFPLDEIIRRLAAVKAEWERATHLLEAGLSGATNPEALLELNNARVAQAVWHSAWCAYRIYRLQRNWTETHWSEYRQLIVGERDNLQNLIPCLQHDPRQGFHIEAHCFMFNEALVRQKIAAIDALLAPVVTTTEPQMVSHKTERDIR